MSQTVKNSIAPWTELQHLDGRVRFHILLDAETQLAWSEELPSFINLNRVPPSFRPQHALHKARALEFFRRAVLLDEDDWVLHLDEETLLDSYAMTAVIDFIERGDEHIGIVDRWRTKMSAIFTNLSLGDHAFQRWRLLAKPIPYCSGDVQSRIRLGLVPISAPVMSAPHLRLHTWSVYPYQRWHRKRRHLGHIVRRRRLLVRASGREAWCQIWLDRRHRT